MHETEFFDLQPYFSPIYNFQLISIVISNRFHSDRVFLYRCSKYDCHLFRRVLASISALLCILCAYIHNFGKLFSNVTFIIALISNNIISCFHSVHVFDKSLQKHNCALIGIHHYFIFILMNHDFVFFFCLIGDYILHVVLIFLFLSLNYCSGGKVRFWNLNASRISNMAES